ncbi:MAG: TIGR03619 family F420-dependent LLM class oxidoreductase [Ilumatobacteraceae bacterium]
MEFMVQYPLAHPAPPEFLRPDHVAEFAKAAESAGFAALGFTEHPAPSRRWLASGGHESFDPLAALAFCAAVTHRIRLMTYLSVVPYHRPLLLAKAAATVDVLSGGRLVMVVGSGYLRSEFTHLDVDFARRNDLLEAGLRSMRAVWSDADDSMDGSPAGPVSRPLPVQRSGPPLWFGGNSRVARRRAVELGSGWSPNQYAPVMAASARTPALSTMAELGDAIGELRAALSVAGRSNDAFDIQVASPRSMEPPASRGLVDHVAELESIGATWFVHVPPHDSFDRCIEAIAEFGATVIAATRSRRR